MEVIDQMGRVVKLSEAPRRVVSIVPSQTELLVDLGLGDSIAGVTRFCIHPAGFRHQKANIGGTKSLKLDLIRKLKPDLIIGNKEENEQSQVEALSAEFPVWMSDIHDLGSSLGMISSLGKLFGVPAKAETMATSVRERFNKLVPIDSGKKVLYLIWKDPYMSAGPGTFIDDMLKRCGFQNCMTASRYPEVELEEVSPDIVFLSSEPYPFSIKHIEEIAAVLPHAKIELADGEYFSWYGSRLLKAPAYFQSLIDRLQS